jgi:hypothetical protein
MTIASFFLPLPDLIELANYNALEAARGRMAAARDTGDRTRQNAYNERKRKIQADCVVALLAAGSRRVTIPFGTTVRVHFTWFCPDRRLDPDNVAAAKKIVMDALARTRDRSVGAGVIHCDGWHCVAGFSDSFVLEGMPAHVGVRVSLEAIAG